MAAAQELVELFCELIAARLPIIEAQKYVFPSILCALEMLIAHYWELYSTQI